MAVALHNRFGLSGPLARLTADRFEILLSQRLILRDLGGFTHGRIRRIHGRRVSDLLSELLARRVEQVDTALEGLRLQYPGYAETLERSFIQRIQLRLEEREYDTMRADALIGDEVHTALMQGIEERRLETEKRPDLDVALRRSELVRQFPLFADLDEGVAKRLAKSLAAQYVNAGEIVMHRDSAARSVFFIATGAVEMEQRGQSWLLGRGEMFGQMAILTQRPRMAEARAIAPTTLLKLDEARFRRLLKRSETLREAVRASAVKRGLDPDSILPS